LINKDENSDIKKEESLDPAENPENSNQEEAKPEIPVQENTFTEKEESKEEIKELEEKSEVTEEVQEEKAEVKGQEFTEEETEEIKLITSTEKINKQSNYQISLLDENHLRAKVLTNKLVAVLCSVKDKYTGEQASGERQTNKIFVHPKEKPQEVEILLSVGSQPAVSEANEPMPMSVEKESNYQVSLVDENLLRVFVVTEKSVSIDCIVKDEDVHSDGSNETQANRIYIHPKDKAQEVEIIITIGSSALAKQTESITVISERKTEEKIHKTKLTPNPIVANLIQTFSDASPDMELTALTPEDRLEEKLGPKNPWKIYKDLMHRNLLVGLAGAVLIYVIAIVSFYTILSKKNSNADIIEAPRLIVMQDLPENQFQQQNVEDPNKPKEEIKESEDGSSTNKIPPIIPKKVKPPRIISPNKTKTDSNDVTKELDSLRKINNNVTNNNGKNPADTNKKNLTSGNNPIPDSTMRGLKENEVGLVGKFPPYWKQIDSREVDINKKEFTGVLLVDTSVSKKSEALTMSVQIDKNNEYWKQYNFKNVFLQDDSTKNTIYNIDPKQEGDQTYYRFYISGMAYNIYIAAFINNEHFEKHKAEVEQVVRTIRIQKPGEAPKK